MNSVTKVFRAGLILIMSTVFIISGILMSIVSGIIEFKVFVEVLSGNSLQPGIISIGFCTFLAVCFEGVKNFSSLIAPLIIMDYSKNSHLEQFSKITKKIRYALVIVSFICTIIFTSNSLIKTSLTDTERRSMEDEILEKYNSEKNKINEDAMERYEEQKIIFKEQETQSRNSYIEISKTQPWNTELISTYYNNHEVALATLNNFVKNGIAEIKQNSEFYSRYEENEKYKNKELDALSSGNTILKIESHYLNNFLGVLGLQSDNNYVLSVFIISLLISFLIEGIIIVTASFLSTNSTTIYEELDKQIKFTEQEKLKFNNIARLIYKAFICLATYILIMLFYDKNKIMDTLFITFIAYVISISSNNILSLNKELTISSTVFSKISNLVTSGLISFVLYVIMGFFLGDVYLDMSSLAVTIGAIIGQSINFQLPGLGVDS